MKLLYLTFIVPYFTYGIGAWFAMYKNYTSDLFILQKKAIWAINNLQYRDHTNFYFKSMKILKSTEVYKHKSCVILYKTLLQNFDPVLYRKLYIQRDIHTHNTR